jgi:mevalonate kinase
MVVQPRFVVQARCGVMHAGIVMVIADYAAFGALRRVWLHDFGGSRGSAWFACGVMDTPAESSVCGCVQGAVVVASAPGSVMLSGEHAVLHGAHALVGAVSAFVRVRLVARTDRNVHFHSALGACDMTVDRIMCEPPFTFAGLAADVAGGGELTHGYDLFIEADMPADVGLGSSAAVTVAVYAAVYAYRHGTRPREDLLWQEARKIIRKIQGCGSGADAAASVYGGIVLYHQDEGVLEHFTDWFPAVTLFYVGYKTPSREVIEFVNERRSKAQSLFKELDTRMERCTDAAADALAGRDISRLAKALTEGQTVMDAYGVCDAATRDLLARLGGRQGGQGVKISGSGLGDCVLVIGGSAGDETIPFREIPITFSGEGVRVRWT